ncbi:MAG: condensation domain-containing protein, partial [Psychrosphaera sp.]|nr:condensation domain-containing protein [Psychrosphaera sp.]
MTHNGKLDSAALPQPQMLEQHNYVAPSNALEQQLCQIWQDLLALERIGIDDNFFRIGGDSIVSIQLVSKIRQAGYSLQVVDIFDAPTIGKLAKRLANKQQQSIDDAKIAAEQGVLEGEFELLGIQQWFFNQPMARAQHWNQAFMMTVPAGLSRNTIAQAIAALARQHDMLRCHFNAADTRSPMSQSYQRQATAMPLKSLDVAGLTQAQVADYLTQWQSDFSFATDDGENGDNVLWQVGYLQGYDDGLARLFFAFHHLIIDAVSWRIIVDDMTRLLQNQPLLAKSSSYRQWVNALTQGFEQAQDRLSTGQYWRDVLKDHQRLAPCAAKQTLKFAISPSYTAQLLHHANYAYNTQINDLLLSALAKALKLTLGRDINPITLEGHGREAHLINRRDGQQRPLDLSATVGWFTTMYPIGLR